MRRVHPTILHHARELRKLQTQAEERLWYFLRGSQLEGLKFRRQHPIERYIVDFYCAEKKLVVEIDGDSHAEPDQELYDLERTAWLVEQGCYVLRFTNEDVYENSDEVLQAIIDCANHRRDIL